eukprot:gene9508-10322_t
MVLGDTQRVKEKTRSTERVHVIALRGGRDIRHFHCDDEQISAIYSLSAITTLTRPRPHRLDHRLHDVLFFIFVPLGEEGIFVHVSLHVSTSSSSDSPDAKDLVPKKLFAYEMTLQLNHVILPRSDVTTIAEVLKEEENDVSNTYRVHITFPL